MAESEHVELEILPTLRELQARFEARVLRSGDLVRGRVVGIDDETVTLDVDGTRGVAPRAEFAERPTPGSEHDIYVDDADVDPPQFSRHKAQRLALWRWVEELRSSGETTPVTIIAERGDTLSVDLGGFKAMLPRRELAAGRSRTPGELIGTTLDVRITRIREKKGQILVSERAPLAADREVLKAETLSTIEVGQVIEGEVKRLTNFGAFVDVGGVDGLLHINDMSHRRLRHPSDVVDVGDVLAVKVLKYDPDKERIGLGLKQLQPDPWSLAVERYQPGTQVRGEVVGLTKFGAFVMMPDGIEGLAHISEMAWGKQVQRPGEVVKKGQTVDAWVLRVDPSQQRMGLTLRNPAENPWFALAEKMPLGTRFEGTVARVADFGVFVNLDPENGLDGLVHQSDFSWGTSNKPPKSLFKPGDPIEVMVLGIEPERGRATLGIKQLHADLASELIRNYSEGQVIEGKVTSLMDFGAFIEVEPGLEGLAPNGLISKDRIEHPEDVLQAGQTVKATIARVDVVDRKLTLSLMDHLAPPAAEEPAEESAAEAPARDTVADAPAVEAEPVKDTLVEAQAVDAEPAKDTLVGAPPAADAPDAEERTTAPYGAADAEVESEAAPAAPAPEAAPAPAPEPAEKGNTEPFPAAESAAEGAPEGEGEGA